MINAIKETNIENSLASFDREDLASKDNMLNGLKYNLSFGKIPLNDGKNSSNDINYIQNDSITKNKVNSTQIERSSIIKNKKAKEISNSTNYIMDKKSNREIKEENFKYNIKSERFKKNRNKSTNIFNNDKFKYSINDDSKYYGEKILIDLNDLKSFLLQMKGDNNLKNNKKEKKSKVNKFEYSKRICCIINNSPFMSSNILIKNRMCNISVEYLLGKDKSRFFEKNKNIYKGKSHEELFKKILNDIYQEVDSFLNDKYISIDPSKVNIGQLCKINEKYDNEYLKNKYVRDIRKLDGNAFLRAFIYNYLEQLIIRKDIKKLTEIIGKIIYFLKINENNKETISKVLSVFKIIINYIEQKKISNAYKILIKSFSDDYIFEKIIIAFTRESISESIINHQSYFIIEHLKEIIQNKYIKKNEKDQLYFDYELYIKEIIDDYNNELQYELLIYFFLAPIYEVDLVIYTNNDTKTNRITFKHTNIEYDENDVISVNIFIKFGKISIIYSDQFYNDNQDILPLISKTDIPIDRIKIISNDTKKNCYMCKIIPEEFILIDKYFQLICKNCLAKIIQKIIDKRYSLFIDDDNNYLYEEYFCNRINYTINCEKINSYELNISINDIRNILPNNSDISNEIYSKIIKIFKCEKCKEFFNQSKYAFNMDNCGHLVCINCLKDYIFKMTDEKVILNYYEYKMKQIKFFCPVCNLAINLSKNLINNLFNDDKYIIDAEKRLIDTAKSMCSFCHTNKKEKIKKNFLIVNEFASSNSCADNYLLVHSICIDCDKNLTPKILNNNSKTFFCIFCEENHQYDSIKFNIQRKRKVCCSPI